MDKRHAKGIVFGAVNFSIDLGLVGGEPNRGASIDKTPWLGPFSINWEFEADVAPFLGMFGLPATASQVLGDLIKEGFLDGRMHCMANSAQGASPV